MRAVQRTLLHFAAFTALVFSLYPILAMVFHYTGQSASSVWLAQLYLLLESWTALIHAIFVRRQYHRKPVLVNLLFLGAGALFGIAAFLLTPLPGIFMGIVSALAAFGIYQAGARLFFVEYDTLTHPYVYTAVCIFFILPSIALWLGNHEASFLWQVLLFLLVSCVFAAAQNFRGIDLALQSQHTEEESLPKGLLRYNRLLLCGLGTVILLLVLMRTAIGNFLWLLLKAVIQSVGRFLYWLGNLFTGEEQEEAPEAIAEPEILQETAVSKNEWLTLICTLALAALLIFLMIRYRREIAAGLKGMLHALRAWVMRLLGRSYEQPGRMETAGYTDYLMDLTAHETDWQEETVSGKFQYGRLYRRFRRMAYSAEKYRLGYGLLLYHLSRRDVPVKASSSPREVLSSLSIQDDSRYALWETVTSGYEQVRYSGQLPEKAAFFALEQLLREKTEK